MSDDNLERQVVQLLSRGGPRPGWSRSAACARLAPAQDRDQASELFFPARGDDGQGALVLCARCPVRAQCLAAAIANDERWGIWGGMTTPRRDALVRDLYEAAS